jgi:actin-related protein 9
MTLQDVVGHAVRYTNVVQRQYIWLGLVVTGDVAIYVKGNFFVGSLSYVYAHPQWRYCRGVTYSSFILSNADQHNEGRPKQIHPE